MGNGRNIITQHLGAFYGGCFGSGAVFFKPLFLDATGSMAHGIWQMIGFYAIKFVVFSITTVAGGLLTAWGKDAYANWKAYRRSKKKQPFSKNGQSKDKAA